MKIETLGREELDELERIAAEVDVMVPGLLEKARRANELLWRVTWDESREEQPPASVLACQAFARVATAAAIALGMATE